MSNVNDRIEINTSTFGFCNNLDLSVLVFTQPNLGLRYLDNHLLPGIYLYNNCRVFPEYKRITCICSVNIPCSSANITVTPSLHCFYIAEYMPIF